MDLTTEKEQIEKAIEERTKNKEYTLSDLRPYTNNMLAITITTGKEESDLIMKQYTIRIGYVNCTLEKRFNIKQCRKCWAFDHQMNECEGPDRSKDCYRCGKSGHLQKECESKENCPLCNKEHKIGTGRCYNFKKALSKMRRKERQNTYNSTRETEDQRIYQRQESNFSTDSLSMQISETETVIRNCDK
ncbi:hypothetical protein ABEB36_014386 [Hypothenemus hampei]|uniref:CCHC-type domain-containing protein n=1 Tax=Hypothenemus hampei TaxID=57062 RepID=A0ABD1E4A1_HYPHA